MPLSTSLRSTVPQVYAELNQISIDLAKRGTTRLGTLVCYEEFFVPLNLFARRYVGANLPESLMMQELAVVTRDGKMLFEQMITSNQGLAEEFRGHHHSLSSQVEKLKEFAEKLLADFVE